MDSYWVPLVLVVLGFSVWMYCQTGMLLPSVVATTQVVIMWLVLRFLTPKNGVDTPTLTESIRSMPGFPHSFFALIAVGLTLTTLIFLGP